MKSEVSLFAMHACGLKCLIEYLSSIQSSASAYLKVCNMKSGILNYKPLKNKAGSYLNTNVQTVMSQYHGVS